MAPSEDNSSRCVVCNSTGPLKRCARCHITPYCTTTCQKSDWKSHKPHCNPTTMGSSPKWYDKHRLCQDEFKHEGRLELITWSVPATSQRSDGDDWCEDMGWGNCVAGEDSDSLKRKFETEFSGSEEKLYEYWPQGFRWTCCGIDGDQEWGCDHHGTGSESCTCDFCRMGKAIPNSVYNHLINSPAGKGLNLSRGPDPRSFRGRLFTNLTETTRGMLCLPNSD